MGTYDVNAIPKRFGQSMDTVDERHDSPDDLATSQLKVGVQIEGPVLATPTDRRHTLVLGKTKTLTIFEYESMAERG